MREWYRSWRWRALRREILDRDQNTCQRCGGWGDEAHHVKGRANSPELFWDADNIEVLCRDCHIKEHRQYVPGRQEWMTLITRIVDDGTS